MKEKELKEILDKININELKEFILNNVLINEDLQNRFRVEFNNYFPKLTKKDYENRIYRAINNCCDRHGFIDYYNSDNYEHAMFEFTQEAEKLVEKKDYESAFIIATILLDSIPDTPIDDSNGSTSMVADDCIEIIDNILKSTDNDNILKLILDYIIQEVKTANLYNYGVDLKDLLKVYIDKKIYLNEIELLLEQALESSKEKSYFYNRKNYIEYLIKIYEINHNESKILEILNQYSFDMNVCMIYVDKLIESKQTELAIKVLEEGLRNSEYRKDIYAEKLSLIYLKNNMKDEYKNILYDMFYTYSKQNIKIYKKIKELYQKDEWEKEKNIIIEDVKKEKYNHLNDIYIEEKMYDDLYQNIKNNNMNYVITYEKYLLPKYQKEILEIYYNSCIEEAKTVSNRKEYQELAHNINHVIRMDTSQKISKELLKQISENYFKRRPAMKDEFRRAINNLEEYLTS